jgi:hypothetical protein
MRSDTEGEWLPNICLNGHRLMPPNVFVGWSPCSCIPRRDGHRTFTCQTCWAVSFKPPHVDNGSWRGIAAIPIERTPANPPQ